MGSCKSCHCNLFPNKDKDKSEKLMTEEVKSTVIDTNTHKQIKTVNNPDTNKQSENGKLSLYQDTFDNSEDGKNIMFDTKEIDQETKSGKIEQMQINNQATKPILTQYIDKLNEISNKENFKERIDFLLNEYHVIRENNDSSSTKKNIYDYILKYYKEKYIVTIQRI